MQRALTFVGAMTAGWLAGRARRYDLRGKVALVTGGSRGLGLLIARELRDRGALVAICARSREELVRATELLDGRVLPAVCDVGDRNQVTEVVDHVVEELGPIDILVNNAGVMDVGPVEHMTVVDYQRALAAHFWGPLHATLAVLPEMRERHTGRIVNIASIGGKIAVPHMLPYTASKFALVGFSEGLRAELVKDGICVTTVIPGLMRTGSAPNATFKGRHRAEFAWFTAGASLPLTAMGAERAARRIVDALCAGRPEVVLSLQAKLAVKLYTLAPALAQHAMALVARLLPRPGGIGERRVSGKDSSSPLSDRLARFVEVDARANNEL